jgi:hypothetical protein
MSATITAIPAHPSYRELRGSDGLGLLPPRCDGPLAFGNAVHRAADPEK